MLIHLPDVGVHTTAAGCSLAPLLTGTALAVPRAVTNNIHHRPQSNCQLAALLALLCSTNEHSGTYGRCHTTCHDALAWVPHNDLHPHTLCSWPRGVFQPQIRLLPQSHPPLNPDPPTDHTTPHLARYAQTPSSTQQARAAANHHQAAHASFP